MSVVGESGPGLDGDLSVYDPAMNTAPMGIGMRTKMASRGWASVDLRPGDNGGSDFGYRH